VGGCWYTSIHTPTRTHIYTYTREYTPARRPHTSARRPPPYTHTQGTYTRTHDTHTTTVEVDVYDADLLGVCVCVCVFACVRICMCVCVCVCVCVCTHTHTHKHTHTHTRIHINIYTYTFICTHLITCVQKVCTAVEVNVDLRCRFIRRMQPELNLNMRGVGNPVSGRDTQCTLFKPYEEEDACVSYEEEDTCARRRAPSKRQGHPVHPVMS
jgi:hypothetical protein